MTLGLCKQIELDLEVQKASRNAPPAVEAAGPVLLSAEEALAATTPTEFQSEEEAGIEEVFGTSEPTQEQEEEAAQEAQDDLDADSVFAKLKELTSPTDEGEENKS